MRYESDKQPSRFGPPGDAPRVIDQGSVWIMVAAPTLWALHFVASYVVAAVWCARIGPSLTEPRWIIAGMAVVCVALIVWLATQAVRRYGGVFVIFEEITESSERGRDKFIGHVSLLLCILSGVAIAFTVIPGFVFGSC
ncbi:hypothetical protein AL036_11645 [Salipiger aestuarii]|uniref:hypothetical protein n=1 Tax=Salipiger aestuarii TaxID=568098 RepID=UPI00025B6FF6|nr:hypothetical protein [Salipiger aestuarii]EIE49310.1 hypothetical protein C357_19331 [Citreicella sp. 357]KAA8607252.1 hypothetical protein AL036_11645 [Salipiger aestuarii]KAA8607290.1 hypothetical protein AL037_19005 [Salipiger aestuarii]